MLFLASSCPSQESNTSMSCRGAVKHDPPGDEPTSLLSLPVEMLHEIAIWAPLRSFCQVVHLDVQRVSCIRIQRWYRSIERRDEDELRVGDRVLVRSWAARGGIEYATAAAMLDDGSVWKVRMLDGAYFSIPTSQLRKLTEWADGPWGSNVGRSAALASASKARGAALRAAAMATQAMRAGVPRSQTALVIAAAAAASTAAAAATSASSAAAPIAANASSSAEEARELLMATQHMQDAIVAASIGGGLSRAASSEAAAAPSDESAATLVAQAASAASKAAREASAATSAALAVDSVGSLCVTASTASRASTAAQQVVSAIEALESTAAASTATALMAMDVAAEAMTEMRSAGRALALTGAAFGPSDDARLGADGSASHTHALDAAQAAAEVLRTAGESSDVASLLDSLPMGTEGPAECESATAKTATVATTKTATVAAAASSEALRRAAGKKRTITSPSLPDLHGGCTEARLAMTAEIYAELQCVERSPSPISPASSEADLAMAAGHAELESVERCLLSITPASSCADLAMATGRAALEACERRLSMPLQNKACDASEAHATASYPSHSIDDLVRDGASTVLWCWLPRSSAWSETEIVERTTRAVAACCSHDLIALPDLPIVRELIEHWAATAYGDDRIDPSCVLWFAIKSDPEPDFEQEFLDLQALGLPPLTPKPASTDQAFMTLLAVLRAYRACGKTVDALYTMYPDERTCRVAQAFALRCLGDLDAHPTIGSLRQAKSFLHPSLANLARPALRDAALPPIVRGPRGFCCEKADQLLEAWARLKALDASMPLVIKPAAGSGGDGVRLNATVADLHSVVAQMRSNVDSTTQHGRFAVASLKPAAAKEETILEEMVGKPGQPSPTVYMVGARVAVVADQLLSPCGTENLGNISPATQVSPSVVEAMKRACVELGTHLGLRGQWGVDFVLDEMEMPVMVDLNMGRPNGSLSYYCWRARQPPPAHQAHEGYAWGSFHHQRTPQELAMACTTFCPPTGLPLAVLAQDLRERGLLWDSSRGDGVILAQYLPSGGSVLAASWKGTQAARHIMDSFLAHMAHA
eukprot:CAMPEP_0115828598 /NCGR_PEP_ID=MMETSP0287-20121206/657_1 /TAXON_ID=412157 /ORGANISM="Chrysochromulina rotalis, Strain UIO044" /LENGTH=1056 /DNA_ID=CAMNT_0003281821 /DNA_START=340 /DNA_END=3510 /DNA_ORIENTATION=-